MVGKPGLAHSARQGHHHATFLVELEAVRRARFRRSDRKLGDSTEASNHLANRTREEETLKKKRCTRGDDNRSYAAKFSKKSTNSKPFLKIKRDSGIT